MMNRKLQGSTIVCGPEHAEKCIIWLHGLGASGDDLASGVWPAFPEAIRSSWRAIFPNAPEQPVTLNNGVVMPAWYDLYSLSDRSKEDEAGFASSAQIVKDIITAQIELGIEPRNIVVAGFSQGGAIALYSLLQLGINLGAAISLSAYVTMAGLRDANTQNNQTTAVMLMHGEYDDIVPYDLLASSKAKLQALGYKPQSKSYAMAHEICPEQVYDLANFLREVVA